MAIGDSIDWEWISQQPYERKMWIYENIIRRCEEEIERRKKCGVW